METDISLQDRSTGKKLIIDTKYYGESMKGEHGKKLISANLYQLFAYVMNDDPERTGRTGGLLLYARTDEEIIPDDDFQIIPGNNYMGARTLDLTGSWTQISGSLDNLVRDYFGFCPD